VITVGDGSAKSNPPGARPYKVRSDTALKIVYQKRKVIWQKATSGAAQLMEWLVDIFYRFTVNSPHCRFAPVTNQLAPLANQLVPGKYRASWYPVLPAKLLAFYYIHCHCVASI